MATPLAYLMMIGWPFIALLFFLRMNLSSALICSVIAGYLFLPRRPVFDWPLVPTIDKDVVIVIVALVMCLLFQSRRTEPLEAVKRSGWLPEQGFVRLLLAGLCALPAFTVLTNMDPAEIGVIVRPGLRLMEIPSALFLKLVPIILFIISYKFLYHRNHHDLIIRYLVYFGLIYSIPIIIEIFLSPQLNKWLYGFYQFAFAQQKRGGGFRPVVFLQHGLWTALFVSMTFVSAVFAYRYIADKKKLFFIVCAVWLGLILTFSRSLGAFVLGVVFCVAALILSKRMVILFAAVISVMILLYPMGRGVGLVPTSSIVALAERIDPGRAASLQYRFDNEEMYLERANERPLFGWGGWGRGRLYDEETGKKVGASDAYWVILFSTYGWFGYIVEYSILTSPIFLLLFKRNITIHWSHAAMAAILALNLADMLFNATLTPLTWLLAGALMAAASTCSVDVTSAAGVSTVRRGAVRAVIGGVRPEMRDRQSAGRL